MLTFLFWNTNRRPISSLVVALAKEHSVDVLILAESKLRDADLLEQFNTPLAEPLYRLPRSECESIRVFTRFPAKYIPHSFESARYSFRRLSLPERDQIILGIAHFPSKLRWSDDSQAQECTRLARIIAEQEATVGHRRTLLVGDFNMNPFEKGLIGATGLHAVMSRDVALARAVPDDSESCLPVLLQPNVEPLRGWWE
jgi:hypothetical protein